MPHSRLNPAPGRPLHPLHAVLLGGAMPLYLGTMLADWAYGASYEVQWTNFAAWLLIGALVFNGFALLFALFDLVRGLGKGWVYTLVLAACFVLGVINAFVHAKDAWAAMPMALVLSVVCSVLILVATWFGFASIRKGDAL